MNSNTWIAVVAALAAGIASGYLLFGGKALQHPAAVTGGAQEKKALFYRNPMNPAITSPVPAKDEMGMDYIPVYAGGGNEPAGTVKIDPATQQDIGVRTTKAVEKSLSRTITTVGRITFDESRLVTLHPKVEGWINKLFVDTTGESVKQNTMLLSLYSPQLVATEEEYLLALSNWEQLKTSPYPDIRNGAKRLLDSSLDRLRFFDVPDHQIRELQRTHRVMKNLHIHAPAAGVVTRIGVREGAHVTPASELYQIADLSRVWVLADLYEYEIGWVKVNDAATLSIASLPGRSFSGRITYIYPYLDPQTRTNKVRIEFDNPDGLLKPDMFGDVTVKASSHKPGVYVPREAVLVTGKREHLFVQTAPGRFEPRNVRTGAAADGLIEILSGVKAGESVVSSGQFLIDSESSIREAAAKMMEPKQAPETPAKDMDMGDMQMDNMSLDKPEQGHE